MLLSLDAMVLLEVANACMRICRGKSRANCFLQSTAGTCVLVHHRS